MRCRTASTLTFDLDARVDRDRRFWFNGNIVDLTLRRELTYHAVSDRYVVRDSAAATSRPSRRSTPRSTTSARSTPGRSWSSRSSDGGKYIISVRAGMRRGHLSASLRAMLFWTDDWSRVSDWYTWSLPV